MKIALQQGEEVEFPLGKLFQVRTKDRKQEVLLLGRKRAIYRKPFTVILQISDEGDKKLNPPPPRVVLPPKRRQEQDYLTS